MSESSDAVRSGPLAVHIEPLCGELIEAGFSLDPPKGIGRSLLTAWKDSGGTERRRGAPVGDSGS